MSLRQKYVKIFSEIFPAGAVGVSLLSELPTSSGMPGTHPAAGTPVADCCPP